MYRIPESINYRDVRALTGRQELINFFERLGYDVSRIYRENLGALALPADVVPNIEFVEHIAMADDGWAIRIYLVKLRGTLHSVTAMITRSVSKAYRDRDGDTLLVFTIDYQRLDFVLAERSNAPYGMTQDNLEQTLHYRKGGIYPRELTVDVHYPNSVSLRVLNLFARTQGESVFVQSERLRNAYDVAYWSEPFFNNRALFSDHYLTTLPEEGGDLHKEWNSPATGEQVTTILSLLKKLYADPQEDYIEQANPLEAVREQLIVPVLKALGFAVQPGEKTPDGELRQPDYRLYAGDQQGEPVKEKVLALCLAYAWNRDLDRKVEEQLDPLTYNENPGAEVVALLERKESSWAIVTNGKIWRLYSTKTHSRATNYYEIDLAEIANRPTEQSKAFKYFWFLFRMASFLPRLRQQKGENISQLELWLNESQHYARGLEERLKVRVFNEVFHHFAQGFVYYGQRNGKLPEDLGEMDEAERERLLKQIFDGTLTFLYRLLFLLYAESRNLLPTRGSSSYYEKSLTRLKTTIAQERENEHDANSRIRNTYREESTRFYRDLKSIFHAINKGNKDLNIPTYSGGLFATEPNPRDTSREAEAARFLLDYEIPDRELALGLYRMAYEEDDKTRFMVQIDYKSLGVRQLGSIYEGLLEHKLRVATRTMALVNVEKSGKLKKIVPLAEAQSKNLAIVRERQEGELKGCIYEKGMVYLDNDKHERKATGSFYTPDYIVEYIVKNTVGPILDYKFKQLRVKLVEAQSITLEAFKKRYEQGSGPEPEEATYLYYMQQNTLVEDFFNLRVLDPAMGSGHFLVEAVDYITDRMIEFLRRFTWNPVVYHLGRLRQQIMQEMISQDVSIDEDRLTDNNLLKRQVLKRCIFGVDMNPMAVELAKISLWLDSFTLGAPLSFLDHHLKSGNSLIGARVEEALRSLKEGQLSLFYGDTFWASIALATGGALEVAKSSDSTVTQVLLSKEKYQENEKILAPLKNMLNIYLSHWFSNPVVKGKKGKSDVDIAIDFLRSKEAEQWYQNPKQVDAMSAEQRKVIANMLIDLEKHRFFHWELEFPEVFYAIAEETRQAELKENGGFDAVISNPPYLPTEQVEPVERNYISGHYPVASGKYDLSVVFLKRCTELLGPRIAHLGMIVPTTWQNGTNYIPFRKGNFVQGSLTPSILINLPFDVFPDAYIDTCIAIFSKDMRNTFSIFTYDKKIKINQVALGSKDFSSISMSQLKEEPFHRIFTKNANYALFSRLSGPNCTSLGKITDSCQGPVESFFEYSNFAEDEAYFPYGVCEVDRYELEIVQRSFIRFGKNKMPYRLLCRDAA
jgi:type I restriction-modification system DNA methylase subunit